MSRTEVALLYSRHYSKVRGRPDLPANVLAHMIRHGPCTYKDTAETRTVVVRNSSSLLLFRFRVCIALLTCQLSVSHPHAHAILLQGARELSMHDSHRYLYRVLFFFLGGVLPYLEEL